MAVLLASISDQTGQTTVCQGLLYWCMLVG